MTAAPQSFQQNSAPSKALADLDKFLRVAKAAKADGCHLPIWSHDITALETAVTALAESNTSLEILRTENEALVKTLRETLAAVRGGVIEECAKIADPWPGFNVGQKIDEPDLSVIEVRTKIAAKIRALSQDNSYRVPSDSEFGQMQSARELADKIIAALTVGVA